VHLVGSIIKKRHSAYDFVSLGSTIVCPLYKLTLSGQTQVPLQLRVGIFEGSEKKIHPGSKPLSAFLTANGV